MNAFASQVVERAFSRLKNRQELLKETELSEKINVNIIAIEELKEHEESDTKHLIKLMEKIKLDGLLKKAIAVDNYTKIILDGHHRLHALKNLGYNKIPVVFVDYRSSEILVQAWREGEIVTKDMIINAAFNGSKLPPKTSKHMILLNGRLRHISVIEKEVNIPLEKLR